MLADLILQAACRCPTGRRDWFEVKDNVHRADVLLGPAPRRARRCAALARGAEATLAELQARGCAVAAAPALRHGQKWAACRAAPARGAWSCATPTKASPAPSRTARC
jgi:hypothetical protein